MDTKAFVENTVSRALDKYLELHPDGSSVPAGGATGDALTKASDNDGDVQWSTVMTEEVLNNRTLTPTGWGVAKAGMVQISTPSDSSESVHVDISDLGLASVEDYYVAIMIVGGTGAWGGANIFGQKTDTTSFRVSAYRNGSDNTRTDVSYIVVAKGYGGTHFVDGTGLPVGGEDGEILTKIGNEDGVVDWGFDTGAYLAKYGRKYGLAPAQTPVYVRVQTRYTSSPTNPYGSDLKDSCRRFRIPVGGQLQNVDSILNGGLLSSYDLYVTFTGYQGERKVLSSFRSSYNGYYTAQVDGSDRRLFVQATSTVESGDILLDVVVADPNRWTQNNGVTQLRFVAREGYDFGLSDGMEPYDIRNLTGMVLDDLKVTSQAVPTDWGIATVAKTSITIPSSLSATQTIDISGFGFESGDDYTVSCNIHNGTGDWAKVIMNVGSKSATSFMLIAKALESNTTRVDVEYTILAKGYGNNTMSAPNAILESPNGTKYKLKVADDGTLSTEAV